MRVVKYHASGGTSAEVIDLRPNLSGAAPTGVAALGPFNRVGYLKLTPVDTGATTNQKIWVRLVVIPDNATAAEIAAALADAPARPTDATTQNNLIALSVDATQGPASLELGQRFAPGYDSRAQGAVLATHLVVASDGGSNAGPDLMIEGC